jgi:hypothetical protein
MAAKFQVDVFLPVLRDRWRPAMVKAVSREPMVEVNLKRDQLRVCPGFERDSRVHLFICSCEWEGIEQTCQNWTEIRREWNMKCSQGYVTSADLTLRHRLLKLARSGRG